MLLVQRTFKYLENTANYWMEMKDALIGNEDHVILNIANDGAELGIVQTGQQGYQQALFPKLR